MEVEDRRTRPSGALLVPCRARRLARDETCRKPGRPKLRLKLRRWQAGGAAQFGGTWDERLLPSAAAGRDGRRWAE